MTFLASSGARVVVVGTGRHHASSRLPDVPAVEKTVRDLVRCFIERCGLPDANARVLIDPADPTVMDAEIRRAAREADDVFIFCYVGHGVLSPSGELHLATQATVDVAAGRAVSQALEYTAVSDALMRCRARTTVVILDCCFSGRAQLPSIGNGVLLASATAETVALASEGERHTLFTGELIRLLGSGDPHSPPQLTWGQVAGVLRRRLHEQGHPLVVRFAGAATELIVTTNPAYQFPTRRDREPDSVLATVIEQVCPYRGLAPFSAEDMRFFFGRDDLTERLIRAAAAQLFRSGPLIVLGASGAGKTSLLRAGFLPAVSRGELAASRSASWPQLIFTPGADPVGSLAACLATQAGQHTEAVRDELIANPRRVSEVIRRGLPPPAEGSGSVEETDSGESRLVLVVDQFEELFNRCQDERARLVFIRALHAAASSDRPDGPPAALVVLGVRADFLGHCTAFSELVPAARNAFLVGPMTTGQLKAVITRPAHTVGLQVEAGLEEILLRDLARISAQAVRHNPSGRATRLLTCGDVGSWSQSDLMFLL